MSASTTFLNYLWKISKYASVKYILKNYILQLLDKSFTRFKIWDFFFTLTGRTGQYFTNLLFKNLFDV